MSLIQAIFMFSFEWLSKLGFFVVRLHGFLPVSLHVSLVKPTFMSFLKSDLVFHFLPVRLHVFSPSESLCLPPSDLVLEPDLLCLFKILKTGTERAKVKAAGQVLETAHTDWSSCRPLSKQ